jgi:hypothetical protein
VQDEEEALLMLVTAPLIRLEAGRTEAGDPTALVREVRPLGESSAGASAKGSAVEA